MKFLILARKSLIKLQRRQVMKEIVFKFDKKKATEVILYIASKAPISDIYHVLKILYFADKKHLNRYGRFVCGDSYIAMGHGPVPSGSYNLIKNARFRENTCLPEGYKYVESSSFQITGKYNLETLREADLDMLSESDIECITESIAENGKLSFNELKQKSHDKAYDSADENDFISTESIVLMLEKPDEILQHLREQAVC